MRPDRSNYETWIIDYLDGNLDDDQVRILFSFLSENPDLMEEFKELETHSIKIKRVEFRDKNSLKKSVHQLSEEQFENLCVAYLENDLSPEQRNEVEEIIRSDAGRRRTLMLIGRSRLIPPQLTYPHKKRLYRFTVLQKGERIAVSVIGIAATLLILVTLFVNTPDIVNQTEYIAIADTFHKPPVSEKLTEAPELKENIPPSVTEKSMNIVEETALVAENVPAVNPPQDSAITVTISEIGKAEFRQEVALASLPEPAGLTVTQGTNTIVTDYYAAGTEEETRSLAKFIRDRLRKTEPAQKEKITAFDVADAGINGINRLFGWDISLEKNRDNQGTVKSVNFNSKLIKVSAPVKKSEAEE